MTTAKLALVDSVATLMMTAGASAQSNMNSNAGMSGNVSAATHCRDANGQVQLKSAMSGKTGSGSATTGSATTGSAAGSTGQSGSTMKSGSTANGTKAGTSAATGTTGTNLPSC